MEQRKGGVKVLTVKEAAFAADVSERTVNSEIDRKKIQSRTLRRKSDRATRGVGLGETVFLKVRRSLAPTTRSTLYSLLKGKGPEEIPSRFETNGLVIDISEAIRGVERRVQVIEKINKRVEEDASVRGGEPVFRGTRIPVFTISQKLEAGATVKELLEDYPRLGAEDLEIAGYYAELYPRQGRPPTPEWTSGLTKRK